MTRTVLTALAAALSLAAGAVHAETIRAFVGGAMTAPVRDVAAAYTRRSGVQVEIVSDTTGALVKRLQAGAPADLVVVTTAGLDTLQKAALIVPAGRADLARGLMGVAIKAGAKPIDVSTVDALKKTLIAARSVSYVDPKAGGTSGTYFEGLLARLGVADQVRPKTVYRTEGAKVAEAVARGEAELGISFTSELARPGVTVAGPLPAPVQRPTVYAAALTASTRSNLAALRLLHDLETPVAAAAVRKAGLEPLSGR
jgi:molybdate transport system substrate-binding protein